MVATRDLRHGLWPLHAIFLAFPIALFTGNLLADIAYLKTAELQWTNFAAWLNAGALVFGGVVLAWALLDLVFARKAGRLPRALVYLAVLAVMWLTGLINAFQHSRDGWSSVGTTGLILSVVSTLAALVAGWLFHSGWTSRETSQ